DRPGGGQALGIEQDRACQARVEQPVAELAGDPQSEKATEVGHGPYGSPQGARYVRVNHRYHFLLTRRREAARNLQYKFPTGIRRSPQLRCAGAMMVTWPTQKIRRITLPPRIGCGRAPCCWPTPIFWSPHFGGASFTSSS